MKRILLLISICVLSGCNSTTSEPAAEINSTPSDNAEALITSDPSTIGTWLNTMIEQQNKIQNKYFALCEGVGNQEYPDLLPNEHTKMCVCFAEKMSDFIYSGDEQEFNRYQALDTYKIHVWSRELEACYKVIKS